MVLNTSRDELSTVEASLTEVDDSKSESIRITVGNSLSCMSVVSTTWAASRDIINTGTAIISRNLFILGLLFFDVCKEE